MAEQIAVIDVIVPSPTVVDVAALGVQGPPGEPGPPGPQGPPGEGGGGGGPHAATHQPGGADPLAVDAAAATGSLRTLGSTATSAAAGNDPRLTNARTPTTHATSHQPGGGDALAVDAAAGTGSLRTLGPGATQAAAGTDARFTNARTPTAHAASHIGGGSDPVTVTTLAGYPGGTAAFLRADGTFATPPTGGGLHAASHYVGGGDALAGSLAATDVRIGTNPAQSGAVRLANNQSISARNAANTADINLIQSGSNNLVYVGYQTSEVVFNGLVTGISRLSCSTVQLPEIAAPAAPPANGANLWLEDNGSGKSRLMVRFATGAAVQLAIEP